MNHPDPKKHKQVSFAKSGMRLVGYVLLPIDLIAATTFLVLSEALGIYEETV